MNQMTELVGRARSGDVHAFALLYEQIYKDLYRFALCTLRQPHDAEDAVSDTVTDAFAQIGTLREPDAFRSWMFRILTAKCAKRIRSYQRDDSELEWSDEDESPSPTDGGLGHMAERLDVRQAFGALPKEDRLILSMDLFAGYSSSETGSLLNLNANTVRSRHKRALQKLREMLL